MKGAKVTIKDINSGQEESFTLQEAFQFIYEHVNRHTGYAHWAVKTTAILGLIQTLVLLGYLSYRFIGPYILK